jgi:3-dehydroquinate dehydratase/shikimate dehydrogenase
LAPKRPPDTWTIDIPSQNPRRSFLPAPPSFLMDSPPKPRVCISLCEPTVAALEPAIAAAAAVCDLIEVRLDCLDPVELEQGRLLIEQALLKTGRESILTFRPAEQGGRRELDYAARYAFWQSRSSNAFAGGLLDLELDLVEGFNSPFNSSPDKLQQPFDWSRVICSHHDFGRLPADLDSIYERMTKTPARVLKIAVRADDVIDCLPIFELLKRAQTDGRELIAIAMGAAGVATRLLGPARGAFMTYASRDRETATAPGQVSVSQLKEVYRLDEINQQTQIFGLVGLPVAHSLSPLMHNAAFAAAATNAVYIPFEVRDLRQFFKRMVSPVTRELDWNLRGLSVTAPHKFAVMEQLDWIDPAAKEIGAVNTIVVEGDALRGFNTDAAGFIKPLVEMFGDLRGARCAVIGAGGAASAALWSIRKAGAETTIFARDVTKVKVPAQRFSAEWKQLDGAQFGGFDVVINATPMGTLGSLKTETPTTAAQLHGARLVYDLVYNPTETRFLREGRAAGCETLGGLPMLVTQAAEQLRLWTGSAPAEEVMYEAVRRGLDRM